MLSVVEYRAGNYINLPVSTVALFYRSLSQSYRLVDRRSEKVEEIELNKAELSRKISIDASCLPHMMPLNQCRYCYESLTNTLSLKAHLKKCVKSLHGMEFRLLQQMQDCFTWANTDERPSWMNKPTWEKSLESAGKCGGKIYKTLKDRLAEWKAARDSERPKAELSERYNPHPISKFNPFIERLVYEGFILTRRTQEYETTTEVSTEEVFEIDGSGHIKRSEIFVPAGITYQVVEDVEVKPDDLDYLSKIAKTRKKEYSQDYRDRIKRVHGITLARPTVTRYTVEPKKVVFNLKKESE